MSIQIAYQAFAEKYKSSNPLVIKHIVDRRVDYNLNPQFQRGSVWSENQRRNFIYSLVAGLPVGNVIVNMQEGRRKDVIDAKQRIETVLGFVAGDFKVRLSCGKSIKDKLLSYIEIKHQAEQDQNSDAALFLHAFESNSRLVEFVYSGLTNDEQVQMFEVINQASNLKAEEKIYCSNYAAGAVLRHMWKRVCQVEKLSAIFPPILRYDANTKGNRDKSTAFYHKLLLLNWGPNLIQNEVYAPRNLTRPEIQASAVLLQKRLLLEIGAGEDLADHPNDTNTSQLSCVLRRVVDDSGLGKMLSQTIEGLTWYREIVRRAYEKKVLFEIVILDFTSALIDFRRRSIISDTFISEHIKIFAACLKEYNEWTESDREVSKSRNNVRIVQLRKRKLDGIFLASGLDLEPKLRQVSANQRQNLVDDNTVPCVLDAASGEFVPADRAEVHHAPPVALSSTSELQLMDRANNRKKGVSS